MRKGTLQDFIQKFAFLVVKKLKANDHLYQSCYGSIELAGNQQELRAASQKAAKHTFSQPRLQNYLLTVCLLTVT